MKIVIVVPTIRAERIQDWLEKWSGELKNAHIIIVEDNPHKTFKIDQENVTHYAWNDIDQDLKENAWIIPRRTAAVRSYGFYKAYQLKPDMIITLDDDCYPDDLDFIDTHRKYLSNSYPTRWIQHAQSNLKMRGVPKQTEEFGCVLNMGLWSNVPDLDGETQKENPEFRIKKQNFNFHLAKNQYAPISSMNLSVRPEAIPAFYFLLMGPEWGFDRFDDIWAGIFLKKISDHLGYTITGGSPYIWHDRASNPDTNIEKEKTGKKVNEFLWKDIDQIELTAKNFKDCYIELAQKLSTYSPYWEKLKKAMIIWANLF